MKAFTQAETQSHLTAQFRWVPFVARLLSEGPLRGASAALKRDPQAVNQEALAGIQAIMNRAVWKYLARDCGWPQRRIVDAQGELRTCRLWQQPGLPPLRFSDESVELLLAIYNGTRGSERIAKMSLPECLQSPGDLLLHHIIFLRLHSNPQLAGIEAKETWGDWLHNPLNALSLAPLEIRLTPETLNWDALLAPDLRPYLPWIFARLRDQWLEAESKRWKPDTDLLGNRLLKQAQTIRESLQRLEAIERPDLAAPILEFFQIWITRRAHFRTKFETVTQRHSMRDRQDFGRCLSDLLSITQDLTKLQCDLLDLHPVERESPAKLFLSAWEDLDFSSICWEADEFRRQITPTLS